MGTLFSSRQHGKIMEKQCEDNDSEQRMFLSQNKNNESEQWEKNGKTMGQNMTQTWILFSSRIIIKTIWKTWERVYNSGKQIGKQWDRTWVRTCVSNGKQMG
jgi:hypothetical protein